MRIVLNLANITNYSILTFEQKKINYVSLKIQCALNKLRKKNC